MKRITIRMRIALFYALASLLMLALVFVAISAFFSGGAQANADRQVRHNARLLADELDIDDGTFEFDLYDDDLEEVHNSSSFSLFTLDNALIAQNHDFGWMAALPKQWDDVVTIEHGGTQWLKYDMPIQKDGVNAAWVRVLFPLSAVNQAIQQLRTTFLFVSAGCICAAFVVGYALARRALSPLTQMTEMAKRISRGNFSERLRYVGAEDEVGELACAFDTMLDTIEESIRREKQFTLDASHELRTPLAVILLHADEAIDNPQASKEDYRQSLRIIQSKSRDMQKMLSQLLFLARDQEQAIAMQSLAVNPVLEDIVEEMGLRAQESGMTLHLDAPSPAGSIQADLLLFTRMMMNLIDNAIQFGHPGGRIDVRSDRVDGQCRIQVIDDGAGIDSDDLPHIFERFYRGDKARSGGGTGLGLSFVEWIVRCHRGRIEVESEPGEGSRFSLYFPLEEDSE